jgi:sensor c-di-GMP phosphodiesterase-like protein
MTTEQKLDTILSTLTAYIEKQESFNGEMIDFKNKQMITNDRLEDKVDSLRREMGEFRHQEELQHNATHRLIMQAFEHINEMKAAHPWEK